MKNVAIEPKQIKLTLIKIQVLFLMPLPYTKPHLVEFRYSILGNGRLVVLRKACRKSLGIGNPILGDKW